MVEPGRGGALPYLKVVGNLPGIDLLSWHFIIPVGPFDIPLSILSTLSFCRKIGLSLSHLVPEIIWPNIDLSFHQNLSFDNFEAFCSKFVLHFRSCWPPFSLFLYLVTPLFYKTLDPIGSIIACWTPILQMWWSTPHPRRWNLLSRPLMLYKNTIP